MTGTTIDGAPSRPAPTSRPTNPKAIASAQRIAELIRQANPEGIDR